MTTQPFTALHVPADALNPYNRLLAEALESLGVHCDLWVLPPKGRNPRRLLPRLRRADLVHWHWTQGLYQGRSAPTFVARLLLFSSILWELRLRRIPQVLTVHNLLPHEHAHAGLHRIMFHILGQTVDRILVHHEDAVEPVASLYGHIEKIRIVPMVDYGNPVPSATREHLRERWGLMTHPRWAVLFGPMRPYKRIEDTLRVAGRLAGHGIGLVVVGRCPDAAYARELEALNEGGVARLIFRNLEEDELSELLFACDVAVMAYRSTALSSSAVQLALSHGLPVVGTDALAFRELVRRGLVTPCTPDVPDDFVSAVLRAVHMRTAEWLDLLHAYRCTCSRAEVGRRLADVYAELCPALRWLPALRGPSEEM